MKKNKIVFLGVITIILIVITIYIIVETYAVFYTEVESKIAFERGTWNIYINDTDVKKGLNKELLIENINISSKETVKEDKMAPGMTGDFTISICPKDTKVSVRYDITVNLDEMEYNQFEIKNVENVDNTNEIIRTGENTYTGIIKLEDISDAYKDNIKFEIEWLDDEKDIEIGSVYNNVVGIPLTINVTQYLGEDIVEY